MKNLILTKRALVFFTAAIAISCLNKPPRHPEVLAPKPDPGKVEPNPDSKKPLPEVVATSTTPETASALPPAPGPTGAAPKHLLDGKWDFFGFTCANKAKPTFVAEFENKMLTEGLPIPTNLYKATAVGDSVPVLKRNFTWDILVGEREVSFRNTHLSLNNLSKKGFADVAKRVTITEPEPGKLIIVHNEIEKVTWSPNGENTVDLQPALNFMNLQYGEASRTLNSNAFYSALPKPAQDFLLWIEKKLTGNASIVKSSGDVMQSVTNAKETVDYSLSGDSLVLTNSEVTFTLPFSGSEYSTNRVDNLVCGLNGSAIRTYKRVDQ